MAYAYWKGGRADVPSVFDMFFRVPPFGGEFTVFCGLEEVIRFIQVYTFTPTQLAYVRTLLPHAEEGFWTYLANLDCSEVRVYAIAEGSVVFPRVPLLRVEGPLGIVQLLETTLLNLCNFASLVCTNAVRHRLVAGPNKTLLEFGLRRAQGSDGGMSATHYSYVGGFDGTSNVAAGMAFGMRPSGTMAHSLVCAYAGFDDLKSHELNGVDIVAASVRYLKELGFPHVNGGETAAFIAFSQAFSGNFIALVDTYDTLNSGVPNFIAVALALRDAGFAAKGLRLDSGDLAYLSREARKMLERADVKYGSSLAKCIIIASNDLNEDVLVSLAKQGHSIDAFGIGTNLVTCQAQPALGMVYKLVELNGEPRIKLSQDSAKITLPGSKEAFRLIGAEGVPLLDLMIRQGEARPVAGKRILARAAFDEKKRAYITPAIVIPLLRLVWCGSRASVPDGLDANDTAAFAAAAAGYSPGAPRAYALRAPSPSIEELRAFCGAQVRLLREDHLRPLNPTPYKVSVSTELFHFIHDMLLREVPIPELE